MLNINNSRKFANIINETGNFIDENVEDTETKLIRILFSTIAKAYLNGQVALHVHVRVRLIGESVSDDLCFLFERESTCTNSLFKQNSVMIPSNSVNNIPDICQLWQKGAVLIRIGELFNDSERAFEKLTSVVRLRPLDDCPRIPINRYPIQNTMLWLTLSELDVIKEVCLSITDRKLVPPTWFMTVSKDKLTDEMVEGTPKVMDNIASNHRKSEVGFWERFNRYNVPGAITPYIEHTLGVRFNPSIKFRYEAPIVLISPSELCPNSFKVGDSNTHMLQYPYGEEYEGKDTKDTQRARDSRTHKRRISKESQEGDQTFTCSQPEEVKTQTSYDHHPGDCISKNIHSGSLEDA